MWGVKIIKLCFALRMMENKIVVVGMSGGVDSSVAAFLLKRQGYKVIGLFMKSYSDTKDRLSGDCSWIEERRMAQKVAAQLGIPLITIDNEKEYKKKVIVPMFRDYARGLTPNPDILCNTVIKFPALWHAAKNLGADFIATGHYARVRRRKGKFELLSGRDKEKDQSYFLSELTGKDLAHVLFPVGNLTKQEVRRIAKRDRFPNWDKKGTSGICFVGNVDMKKFLKRKIKEKRGDILASSGEVVGSHLGIMFFTIGERIRERKGFTIDKEWKKKHPGKLYVARKISGNKLVIAEAGDKILKRKKVFAKNFRLVNGGEKINGKKFKGRIRHLGGLHLGTLKKKEKRWVFEFSKGLEGVAEGQQIVLYNGERVVGGGEIRL